MPKTGNFVAKTCVLSNQDQFVDKISLKIDKCLLISAIIVYVSLTFGNTFFLHNLEMNRGQIKKYAILSLRRRKIDVSIY
jgi:hypothetical protein